MTTVEVHFALGMVTAIIRALIHPIRLAISWIDDMVLAISRHQIEAIRRYNEL